MWMALFAGILFGAVAQYARIGDFDTINDMITGRNKTLYKTLLFALGIGTALFFLFVQTGWAHFDVKPFVVTGVVVGGLVFGIGAALLGYCPGTMLIALGNGSLDALFGYLGGLLAGLVFILIFPSLSNFLGPNFGAVQFLTANPLIDYIIVAVFSVTILIAAVKIK